MDSDREDRSGRVPLSGFGGSGPFSPVGSPPPVRRDGIRHARRVSNWTAAALLVGTAGAAAAFTHQAFPATAPPASTAAGTTAGTTAVPTGTTAGTAAGAPQVTHSVATTSGSVVTVTTTRTVNGKTIVTRTQHHTAYHDD